MGLLTDYFAARDDNDARGVLIKGPKASGVHTIESKSLDPIVTMATLEAILTGGDALAIIRENNDELVAQGGDDGPWVVRVKRSAIEALLPPDGPRLSTAAVSWAATEELIGSRSQDLYEFLWQLAHLAEWAGSNGRSIYCWMSL